MDDAPLQTWNSLNPTERYGSLLEAWLLRGLPEIVGEDRRAWASLSETFDKCCRLFSRLPDEGLRIAGDDEAESDLRFWPGWHNLGLLELFGLLAVRRGPPESGKGWRIAHIRRAPLGDALLAALYEGFFGDQTRVRELETSKQTPFGVLQPVMQPYLPAWQKTLVVPEWTFRDGLYFFRASLGATWRRIAIPASAKLDALAAVILDAFEFGHDHLYRFSHHNRLGVLQHVNHVALDGDGPWMNRERVGDLPLDLGQTMVYLFDFGDWWEFDVTLERVDLPDKKVQAPTILDGRGAAPQQYPVWDDEDW